MFSVAVIYCTHRNQQKWFMNVAISSTLRTKHDVCFFGIPESKITTNEHTSQIFMFFHKIIQIIHMFSNPQLMLFCNFHGDAQKNYSCPTIPYFWTQPAKNSVALPCISFDPYEVHIKNILASANFHLTSFNLAVSSQFFVTSTTFWKARKVTLVCKQ